ncbi:MAG: class I tRNA ligase family protein, partial [Patescibacteria group bacterium]
KYQVSNWSEVEKYIEKAKHKTELMRIQEGDPSTGSGQGKTGVELKGVKAINPANNEKIPVWVSDYVLAGYGTGAIMAVPAHDERDFEFAKKFKLPVKMVICPNYPSRTCPILDNAYEGGGYLVDSGKFDGMKSEKAKWEITKFVGGKKETHYRLRDWLISRQRYWGPPIPLVFCEACKKRVEIFNFQFSISKQEMNKFDKGELENPGWIAALEEDLPVKLPFVKDFRPRGKGESPLASEKSFYETNCPRCGGDARRETDVSDTFLDSAWYYLRYPSVREKNKPWNKDINKKWFPVDMYTGGAEHSVLHLLYVRFLALALQDLKLLEFSEKNAEPFPKFRAHGLLIKEGAKMSKSKGNIVNPDLYIKNFGADTLRMYLMFLAPFEQGGDFRDAGILGIARFLERVWKLFTSANIESIANERIRKFEKDSLLVDKIIHRTIKKVTEDIELLHYNTAISALMILLNKMEESQSHLSLVSCHLFLKLLAPFAPYITEELWEKLGNKTSIHKEKWPEHDPKLIKEETYQLIVQVNGKHRATIEASIGISQKEAEELAMKNEKVSEFLGSKKPKKIIFVKDRLINFVV